ncbi:class IV adenylate cyclase [Chitinimonas naiadis]
MANNIEIKANVADLAVLEDRVKALAMQPCTDIAQDDTFFACPNGRLKLRAFSADAGELIFYQRPDRAGPKSSFYILSTTQAPDTLRETLTLAYGQVGRVRKQRRLYQLGRTRVHLDEVEGLGSFMELEVVLAEGEAPEPGAREAQDLIAALGILPEDLIETAYVDLLRERALPG